MKTLRNILTSIFSFFILSFLISSCTTEEVSRNEEISSQFSEITSLSSNDKMNNLLFNNYGNNANSRLASKFGKMLFDEAEIGYSNSSNSAAAVIPFGDGNTSLVVLANEDGTIHEEFVASIKSLSNNSSEVNYFDVNGNPTISFTVAEGKIKNVISHATTGRMDWDSCATCAVTSCGADGGCTIMCGLLGPWCLAGIAVACIDSDLAC